MKPIDVQPPHRLFAAIVLMGSGLAVGCGGISQEEGPRDAAGQPSAGAGGDSGAGSSAGEATSTGGSSNTTTYIELGGTTTTLQPVEPGPFSCPPQQWTCVSAECDDFWNGWKLPEGCSCDPTKPLDASACDDDQVFVCQAATSRADGRPFTVPVQLSCTCVPKFMYSCHGACELAYGQGDLLCFAGVDQVSASCGCAVVYLK